MKKGFIYLFFSSLMLIDAIFLFSGIGAITLPAILRMILINVALSLFFNFLLSKLPFKVAIIISFIILLFFGLYAYVELEFKNLLNVYYSLKAYADGGFRVKSYVWQFIKNAKWYYYLNFIPAFIFLIVALKTKIQRKSNIFEFILSILLFVSFFFTLNMGDNTYYDALNNQDNLDLIVKNMGSNAFLFEDIKSVFTPQKENTLNLTPEEEIEDEIIVEEIDYKREFDDSKWLEDIENETNENIKIIDEYLIKRNIDPKNDKTGIYEDYNFIYFLVESFDYIGIDEVLTPTLYKMFNEGYKFPNHYTPVFSCGTGDSEFVSMTSMMPYGSSCTVYTATRLNLNNSLASLFKNKGYKCQGFHNWNDEFYNRHQLSDAYGMDAYYDINELGFTNIVLGWQSDNVLMEKALDYFIDEDKFFSFIVTSTMHWPYDDRSYYGDYYLDKINEVHPDYPMTIKRYLSKTMEFDKSLETLLKRLEEKGKLDNTVICFWPDHHPFNLSISSIKEYSYLADRNEVLDFYKTPLILYCHSDKGEVVNIPCSTFDHVPTIANMFNLNYDPRLYMGKDIFNYNTRVIFANNDWINEKGKYINSSQEFIPFDVQNMSEEEIEKTTAEIKNLIKVGRAIVENNYFNKRDYLTNPKNK